MIDGRDRESKGSQSSYAGSRILVVDDDPAIIETEADLFATAGYIVETALSGDEALTKARERGFDLVLTDLAMPAMDGIRLLDEIRQIDPELPVIMVTGRAEISSAVEAIKQGAYDYLTKPLQIQKLFITVEKALERRRLRASIEILESQMGRRDGLGDLIGCSPSMQQLYHRIARVGPTPSTVLLLGESGTGKEVAAREIHGRSDRRDKPFVAVSCSNLAPSLLDSELFGHEKGSFTGASASRAGLFEAAQGGTIFLDEIGTASHETQASLLRVLQEKEIRRVGGTRCHKVDLRVIAATNLDLERALDEGRFRSDLFYRLSSVVLRLPALRDRPEDIPLLAEHFLKRICAKIKRPLCRFSPRSMELLTSYDWPGNVRELENVIEQVVVLAPQALIRPNDLSLCVTRLARGDHPDTLETLERKHILRVLKKTSGNKFRAARILGIPRSSLYRKLKKIDPVRIPSATR